MIVTFSGMDSAGKSTQIKLLESSLQRQKIRVYSVWTRGGYTPGFEILKRFARTLLGKKFPESGKSQARSRVLAKTWVAYIWLTVAMLDLVIVYGVSIRLRSLLRQVVICDRYLGDTALDFSINYPHIDFEKMLAWKLLCWVTPKPNHSFLLLLSVKTSIARSRKKKEPFPDDFNTLEQRLNLYQYSPWFHGGIKINGEDSINKIKEIIMKTVFSELS